MLYAPPFPLQEKYWRNIQDEIERIFRALIYHPLVAILKKPNSELQNAGNALLEAIANGTVWYTDGHFTGSYNASITRDLRGLGALYNTPSRTWSLARDLLPADIRTAQAHADARYTDLRRSFLHTLDDMNIDSINKISDLPDRYMQTIDWMDGDFKKALKSITISPKLTQEQRGMIAAEWGQNLDLYVKGWAEQRILTLREAVQSNAFAGRRSNDLLEMLRTDYGVSMRKAKFLARQETSLLLSKLREVKYRDVGSNRYRWSTSHDERVRHDHKDLDGKIYEWTSPPVTNRKTAARNNPGQDFGCRCVAIAIFD